MTVVENLTPRVQYNYVAEQQQYPITFPYIERQYVKCMVGDTLLTYNIDYQVPAFDQESLDDNELYLTLLITPTAGDVITIYRETPLDQQAEFPQTAKFSSQKITEALDKLTQQQQEQQDDINTCLRLSKNIPVDFNTELPEPAANQVIQWNEDGTQLINYNLRGEITVIDTKANTAISTANAANAKADAATATANTASTKANTAISTANTAEDKADTAISTANTASTNASNAVSTANAASQTANTASQVATAASEKVDDMEEDIEAVIEAAEKINELEEAVETATTAATTASTAATTASIAATNASTAATNASTAADTATQKAQEVSQALNNIATINNTSLLNGGNINLQVPLVSGTNIKTINNNSILGSGNLTLDGLPSQTGQSGKYLKTDGTDASWAEVEAGDSLPDQTGHSGDLLATDGTDASWVDTAEVYPVIETYSNGASWYRVYATDSTGYQWCEQGGYVSPVPTSYANVSLLKTYKDLDYSLQLSQSRYSGQDPSYTYIASGNRTNSSFQITAYAANNSCSWQASGYIEVQQ